MEERFFKSKFPDRMPKQGAEVIELKTGKTGVFLQTKETAPEWPEHQIQIEGEEPKFVDIESPFYLYEDV